VSLCVSVGVCSCVGGAVGFVVGLCVVVRGGADRCR